jgi:hypothetical protein
MNNQLNGKIQLETDVNICWRSSRIAPSITVPVAVPGYLARQINLIYVCKQKSMFC